MRIALSYFKKYKREFFLLFVFTLVLAGVTNIIPILTQNIFERGVLKKYLHNYFFDFVFNGSEHC